ncbi:hypothetical protein COY90_02150 [Candidatus Roizmanbacteria bacterium CG_4_10_14_0_8_um_filter_39_9]|uniref:SHOCT domain-containing protein n=1 Tax=Candidatus Roizmanbacteria bacterium CG_4_10_14_0_8_um_filter_39_9 TaxID=1974829 RepID=A0A2M7QEG2_9BACT|nr:MAG: hypothetical protein COY90_02150 [Candidatus Roizmanbacteria bacterium CG_4_10_14_0_8_um_filter_39_9]
MMGNYFDNNLIGWNFIPFGWIFMMAFWGLIIWVIFSLVRGNRENGPKEKSPLEILKERYAKGEVDRKEFEEIKKVIN